VIITVTPSDTVLPGTLVTLNASESALACANSNIQFRWSKGDGQNPVLWTTLAEWSGNPALDDSPVATATYRVEVRCAPNSLDLLALQSTVVAESKAVVEVVDLAQRPATIKGLQLEPGASTDLFWGASGAGLSSGSAAVNRYEVRRISMVEGAGGESTGFPGRSIGTGDYTGFGTDGLPGAPGTIGGLKYVVPSPTGVTQGAGPICDDPLVTGDDRYFDNAPGLDSGDLPCFEDPTKACFTDTTDPVDLSVGGNPPGYYYVVTSGIGNSTAAAAAPVFTVTGSHSSRPGQIDPVATCP
jgi:hypothetical protein